MSQLAEQTTRHAVYAEGAKTRYTNELLELLQDIEESLLGRVSRYNVGAWTRGRAEKQLAAFREMANAKYGDKIIAKLNSQISEFAEYEAGFEARSLGNVVPKHNFLLPTETQIMTAVILNPLTVSGPAGGKLLESYIKDFSEEQVERVSNAIRAGFAMGETTPAIVQRLKQEVLPINQRGLVGMARTALQHASAQARQATMEANSDIVKRIRIVATFDVKTCLAEGEKVLLANGRYVAVETVKKGDYVLSGTLQKRLVCGTLKTRAAKGVKVILSSGESVICTHDHLWLTKQGLWVEAQDLKGHELMEPGGQDENMSAMWGRV